MDSIKYVLSEQICKAVMAVAPAYGVSDLEGFATGLLEFLEIRQASASASASVSIAERIVSAPVKNDDAKSTTSSEKKPRARTVSKKMKESFTAMGGTEQQLKEVTKRYKDASDADIESAGGSFEAFGRKFLGIASEEKKEEKKEQKKEEKKEKKKDVRFKWTPTSKKLFKEIVEGSGGGVSDDMPAEFEKFLADKSEEDFKSVSVEGHMRAYAVGKFAPPPPALERHDAEVDEDDEDLVMFNHDGEELRMGEKSGKIYRETDGMDILVGIAGKGRFAEVARV